jgi:LmbE family N-acetylglucosaminyl deacetylase
VIVSLVDDSTWQASLSVLPEWQPPTLPTLVLAPHPDDETLGAGALIATLRARGVPVTVVAATDGENAYDSPQDERFALARVREAEQQKALGVLGVPADAIHRLRLTDSGLHLCEAELTERLMDLAQPGMHLIAPWSGDFHPDHEACARAAATVANAKGLQLTSYFFWTWHRGEDSLLTDLPVRRFMPDNAALRAKEQALHCHRSQLAHDHFEPILPARLLGPAYWPFEVFLPA